MRFGCNVCGCAFDEPFRQDDGDGVVTLARCPDPNCRSLNLTPIPMRKGIRIIEAMMGVDKVAEAGKKIGRSPATGTLDGAVFVAVDGWETYYFADDPNERGVYRRDLLGEFPTD